jgi:hypothetical protein
MSSFRLLVGLDVLRDLSALQSVHPGYRDAIVRGLLALEEGVILDRDSDALLRAFVLLPCPGSNRLITSAVESLLGCVGRREYVHRDLASLGFHRIGRVDDAGRRSLWLREERDAVELRAGREGSDESVRITREHLLFREICGVLSSARFASEWEDPRGFALESSFALDRHPSSIHCDAVDRLPSHAVQPTPEACVRAHGQSCLSCGFTEEIRREMRSSDLSDAEKILRELARVLGMDAMSDVNVTFLGGAILTEVRRLRSPSAG